MGASFTWLRFEFNVLFCFASLLVTFFKKFCDFVYFLSLCAGDWSISITFIKAVLESVSSGFWKIRWFIVELESNSSIFPLRLFCFLYCDQMWAIWSWIVMLEGILCEDCGVVINKLLDDALHSVIVQIDHFCNFDERRICHINCYGELLLNRRTADKQLPGLHTSRLRS